jgi:hypothetical protein
MNNDLWKFRIKDAQGNVIQRQAAPNDWIGEWDFGAWNPATQSFGAGVGDFGNPASVSSTEIYRLEAFAQSQNPTQADYLGVQLNNYIDGSTSRFGLPNEWSSGAAFQGLNGLRNWLRAGDANLDGYVNAADYVIWRKNTGGSGGWLQGDFNGDTMVDDADYGLWRANFGFPPSGSGAGSLDGTGVPEPGAFGLAAVLVGITYARSRRRNG